MSDIITRQPDLEVALCSKCASVFYDDTAYWIERADKCQIIHEECMFCKNPHGFDFLIWKKANVRGTNKAQFYTFAEGDRNE